MPEYQLLADYDRDGMISRAPSEYQLHNQEPGAIVVPNLDADHVPAGMHSPVLDRDFPQIVANENDLTELHLAVTQPAPGVTGRLRVSRSDACRMRLYNPHGNIVLGLDTLRGRVIEQYDIPFAAGSQPYRLEVLLMAGSPIHLTDNTGRPLAVPTARTLGAQLNIHLDHLDGASQVANTSAHIFSIAPLLFTDNLCPPLEFMLCENGHNEPTVKDTQALMQGNHLFGAEVRLIGVQDNLGDVWIQDQLQWGYFHQPHHVLQAALHLPRLQSNGIATADLDNLAPFVSHKMATENVGLIDDLWLAGYRVNDVNGQSHTLSLVQLNELDTIVINVEQLHKDARGRVESLAELSPSITIDVGPIPVSMYDILFELEWLIRRLSDSLVRWANGLFRPERDRAVARRWARDYKVRHSTIKTRIDLRGHGIRVGLRRPPALTITLSFAEIDRIVSDLIPIVAGQNFGGNIEIAPPTANALLGNIVLGSPDRMNPRLLSLLRYQARQPEIHVDTSWLGVGHVDEVLSFVPSRQGFAVLMADPQLAFNILNSAITAAQAGQLRTNYDGDPLLTAFFREQYWTHRERPNMPFSRLAPPNMYIEHWWRTRQETTESVAFDPGENEHDRYYHAMIRPEKVIELGWPHNQFIEKEILTPMRATLSAHLPGVPQISLPVIYDRFNVSPNASPPERGNITVAFMPNAVNLQVVGNHVLVPRPHGPRVHFRDAAAILQPWLPPAARRLANVNYFRRSRLIGPVVWVDDRDTAASLYGSALVTISVNFFDGYISRLPTRVETVETIEGTERTTQHPTLTEAQGDLRRRIQRANPSVFNHNQSFRQRGFHKLRIPEDTVDLFEAYTDLALNALGLNVHWIEGWYYHVRHGELHCGTNVRRDPRHRLQTPWWNVSPASILNFEPLAV